MISSYGTIGSFLSRLFPPELGLAGYLSLWDGTNKYSFHTKAIDITEVEKLALEIDNEKHNCYFGLGLRSSEFIESLDAAEQLRERGSSKNIVCIPGVWTDLDLYSPPVHNDPAKYPDFNNAVTLVESFGVAPTDIVKTANGLHLYWLFDQPWEFSVEQLTKAKAIVKAFQRKFNDHFYNHGGYKIDSTFDLARVLRPPGTHNWKTGHPVPVEVLLADDHRYTVEQLDFTALIEAHRPQSVYVGPEADPVERVRKWIHKRQDLREIFKPVFAGDPFAAEGKRDSMLQKLASHIAFFDCATEPVKLAEIFRGSIDAMWSGVVNDKNPPPSLDDVVDKLTRAQEDARAARAAKKEEDQNFASKLGIRLGVAHTQGETDFRSPTEVDRGSKVAATVPAASEGPGRFGPGEQVGNQGIPAATPGSPGASTPDGAAGAPEAPGGPEAPKGEPSGLLGADGSPTGAPVAPAALLGPNGQPAAPSGPRTASDVLRAMMASKAGGAPPPDGGSGGEVSDSPFYTDAEMAAFARSQKCTVDEFHGRWVVQSKNRYFVFVNGVYQPAIFAEELEHSIPRDLAPVPGIEWFTYNQKGERKRKKPNDIIQNRTTVARKIAADLTIDRSFYEPTKQIFHEAVCHLRPELKPIYDPEIDQWIRLLGGTYAEKLLDWLATVTWLKKQTCALFFSGAPGTGKTMFANGVSRLWSLTGPSELTRIMDNFNSDLLRCPLVFADESIPPHKDASARLRRMIASSVCTISKKFVDNFYLFGAVRIVLASNNDSLISFDDETLSLHDKEALVGRFFHIKVSEAPREYIKSLGGAKGTEGWVEDGDRIAQHVLWLTKNRQVVTGDRFLVEGVEAEMHEHLATSHRKTSIVCEWIVNHALNPGKLSGESRLLVRIGQGEVLVNPNALTSKSAWEDYMPHERFVPSTKYLRDAMQSLSTGRKEVEIIDYNGKPRIESYFTINANWIVNWAERNFKNHRDVQAKINGPQIIEEPVLTVIEGGIGHNGSQSAADLPPEQKVILFDRLKKEMAEKKVKEEKENEESP